ncbi:MAG TPA: ATP-binding protein [Coleofasciculaceae cyanobacterium]
MSFHTGQAGEEVQKQILNPFFTYKPVGSGTELELSISHQIVVEKHQGKLYYVSVPSKGTELTLEVPVIARNLSESGSLSNYCTVCLTCKVWL